MKKKNGDERENVAVDRWENPTERRGKKKGDELWIDGRGSQRKERERKGIKSEDGEEKLLLCETDINNNCHLLPIEL